MPVWHTHAKPSLLPVLKYSFAGMFATYADLNPMQGENQDVWMVRDRTQTKKVASEGTAEWQGILIYFLSFSKYDARFEGSILFLFDPGHFDSLCIPVGVRKR